eukprot:TRINITY_DN1695_c0_g1_i2.p1 TRINITY_DN1695_c0_g1~~TRINITY_DN1695_c0_g1_i2.p1  ORF type:complete len:278 (+),score=56.89 TRINITY_DN1695_c0_g1_i2:457-1290(+)
MKRKSNNIKGNQNSISVQKRQSNSKRSLLKQKRRVVQQRKKAKLLEKQIKEVGKLLERAGVRTTNGVPQIEESKQLILLNQKMEKTAKLEKKLKQDSEITLQKEGMIKDLLEKIGKLESEVTTLKKDAQAAVNEKPGNEWKEAIEKKPEEMSKEEIAETMKQLQTSAEAEIRKMHKEKGDLQEELDKLKAQFRELQSANKTNSHKILEFTRLVKSQKLKPTLPEKKTLAQIKKEEILARVEKNEKIQKEQIDQQKQHEAKQQCKGFTTSRAYYSFET